MTRTPTNTTLKVQRNGVDILTGLLALVLPARPEVIALREIPAGKAFEIYFTDVVAVQETDRLVNVNATSETDRIVGVAHYNTPHASHTEVIAEQRLGNA